MDKTREKAHLLHFKDACSFFPEGEIEEMETPDFVVHTQGKRLGIEHTEAFQPGPPHGASLQAQDGLAQRVVREAESLYRKSHGQALLVQILFHRRNRLAKQRVSAVAEMVVNLIEEANVVPGGSVTLRCALDNVGRFPPEIALIHIYRGDTQSRWCCSSAGYIADLGPEDVQEIISRKDRQLDAAATKCDDAWLLIVAENVRIPSSMDLTEAAVRHRYTTRFGRVFFFWHSARTFIELQTCMQGAGDQSSRASLL